MEIQSEKDLLRPMNFSKFRINYLSFISRSYNSKNYFLIIALWTQVIKRAKVRTIWFVVPNQQAIETPGSCDTQVVEIAAGEVLPGAFVSHTESDGNYSNNACQEWNILAGENQVGVIFQSLFHTVQPLYLSLRVMKISNLCFSVNLILSVSVYCPQCWWWRF